MRDQYSVADEAEQFAAWKAGHRYSLEDRDEWWHPFHDFVVETCPSSSPAALRTC
ncbi:DUF6879 family protein [Kitasatospora sp. NPDC057542]|uniref:DUF6879 family protein n=1 Tax=Streptomycetaceae TaxID=2062 RepID=UPI001CCB8714|nr:DUF6879 family protein [Streptomyces sp. LS1784]